jgi:hypothetical protein
MLAKESVLRRLPANLDAAQRLRCEAIVFSADVLDFAWSSIRETTARLGDKIICSSERERTSLFAHAWTIVDQLHILRTMIPRITNGRIGSKLRSFCELSEPATHMRNKMDHPLGTLPNRAKQKSLQAPLFGVLSYVLIDKVKLTGDGPVLEAATIFSITSGSTQGNKTLLGPLPNCLQLATPVCQFSFTAFDWTIEFDRVLELLRQRLSNISEQVEASLCKQAENASTRSGLTVEELMAPAPMHGNFIIAFDVDFVDPDEQDNTFK